MVTIGNSKTSSVETINLKLSVETIKEILNLLPLKYPLFPKFSEFNIDKLDKYSWADANIDPNPIMIRNAPIIKFKIVIVLNKRNVLQ